MGEARRPDLHTERFVGAVGHQVDAELALGVFHRGVGLAFRHAVALGEELEVMDQRFHLLLHLFALRRRQLVVVHHDGPGICAQPVHALPDNPVGLPQFLDPHQIAVVAIAVDSDRNVEVHLRVRRVRLLLAQVPLHAGTAQHGSRKAEVQGPFGRDHGDAHRALLPDPVLRQQRFVFIDMAGKAPRKVFDEIEQRAFPPLVHGLFPVRNPFPVGLRQVPGHLPGQVAIDAARPIIGGVHARAGNRLVAVHQVLALTETVEEYGHGAHVEAMAAQPQQVIQYPGDLVEHHPDVLGPRRRFDPQQLLDRQDIAVLVGHHGYIVQTVHVTDALVVGLGLRQFLGGAMKQPDVGVGAHHHLAIHFQDQPQHAVRGRMLRAEVHGVALKLSHRPPARRRRRRRRARP